MLQWVGSTGGLSDALSRVLDAVEATSPVEAVEAVTRELGAALRATTVSFLIADLSGRALVRLAHVTTAEPSREGGSVGGRWDVDESATVLPFDGGPVEQVVRTQTLQVLPPGDPFRGLPREGQRTVLAPVTERGEVIGLLEMSLPAEPDPSPWPRSLGRRICWAS